MMFVKKDTYVALVGKKYLIIFTKNPFWTIIKFSRGKMKPGYYRLYVGYYELEVRI